MTTILLPCLA